jgi:Fe2+ or Zn2+ uptake regulation protein
MALTKRSVSVTERILETLNEQGYRSTAPRRALAAAIGEQERHFTAEELRRQLPPKMGRATVYRTLKILVDADVLCRVLLEDGDLHYQLSHQGHHHHLLCVHCGSSQDLTGCDIEDVLASTSARHGFELSGHWLEVYGRCRDCLEDGQAAA